LEWVNVKKGTVDLDAYEKHHTRRYRDDEDAAERGYTKCSTDDDGDIVSVTKLRALLRRGNAKDFARQQKKDRNNDRWREGSDTDKGSELFTVIAGVGFLFCPLHSFVGAVSLHWNHVTGQYFMCISWYIYLPPSLEIDNYFFDLYMIGYKMR
jgi:hypothetical protein